MTELTKPTHDVQFIRNMMESAIRIGIVLVLVLWCFSIVKPFVSIILWGVIIAIAVAPSYESLSAKMGGRRGRAALLVTLLMLLVLIVPASMLTGTVIDGARVASDHLKGGDISIPPPPESVAGWPLIGEKLSRFWELASTNLAEAVDRVEPQIKDASRWLLGAAAGASVGLLKFIAAVIIAGVLLPRGPESEKSADKVFRRIAGPRGAEYGKLTTSTIRSVARGILGVAIIQATLAGIGLLAVGVPGAGLLTVLVLMLCIVQLGPGLVMIPTAIWLFSGDSNLVAVLFAIYTIPVIVIDNVLKPILLGRGVAVPMLVIFMGAIGGFIAMGIIGLFVGSIVLVVGYTLWTAWLDAGQTSADDEAGQETGAPAAS
jgi:predicted PurR-regulated permease PerM